MKNLTILEELDSILASPIHNKESKYYVRTGFIRACNNIRSNKLYDYRIVPAKNTVFDINGNVVDEINIASSYVYLFKYGVIVPTQKEIIKVKEFAIRLLKEKLFEKDIPSDIKDLVEIDKGSEYGEIQRIKLKGCVFLFRISDHDHTMSKEEEQEYLAASSISPYFCDLDDEDLPTNNLDSYIKSLKTKLEFQVNSKMKEAKISERAIKQINTELTGRLEQLRIKNDKEKKKKFGTKRRKYI